jgi:hypothetical protein
MDDFGARDTDGELSLIADAARNEFRRLRRTNPLLWIPGLRALKAKEIAIGAGADSGATTQLVADFALNKTKPNLKSPVMLRL